MMSDKTGALLIAFLLMVMAYAFIGWGFSWFCNAFLPIPHMAWWQGWISAVVLSLIFGGSSWGGIDSD